MGSNVRQISVSIPLFQCVNALPSKRQLHSAFTVLDGTAGHEQPQFSSTSRLESVMEKTKEECDELARAYSGKAAQLP
ncbi:hypothetical protein LDENG_00066110 [Lucifuga dentata]|nr:hypothetical protein LDENG_00066110 [Lucifuga dentata]